MPEQSPLLPTDPESIGRYPLEGRLGAGGQGTVYLGRDERERRTAIKLLHPHLITHDVARARFLAEVEIARRVAPFCTAQVLDSGVVHAQPYIVSEFVDGPSLQTSVRDDGPRGEAALDRLAINTVTALAAIHEGGVVHRDFKPGNVLLGPDGPVVIDFGISRALDLSQSLTSSQVVGTPGYMAPEHIDGQPAGPEADMFAWAAAMVFAATGRRAFGGTSASAVALAVLHSEPDLDGLEGDLAGIVRSCLDKDPAQRPTAAEVSDLLRPVRTPQATAAPAPPDTSAPAPATTHTDPPASGPRRRRLQIAAAAITVLAISALAYWLAPGGGEGDASHPSANGPSGALESPTPSAPRTTPSKSASGAASNHGRTTSSKPGTPQQSDDPQNRTSPGPPATKKPSPAKPRTLGTLSRQDQGNYCKAHGYPYHVVLDDQVVCSKDPDGDNGTIADATTVCRWKYSGQPHVHANGKTCISDP
ncbi:serine/threonine-protein kinase [Actinomadura darangshiensis]|uniref:serine/threonine-protein kinase n=1 Tax=Actinomadura darangshiensis TaxID=705336 RepID=UPI001408F78B|nr:serine/threonine-protein kinase [Actinomadura darangshiensis]